MLQKKFNAIIFFSSFCIALRQEWLGDVKGMADRIITMRQRLKDGLAREGSTRNWEHITDQIGMFCFTGMTPEQVRFICRMFRLFWLKKMMNTRVAKSLIKRNRSSLHDTKLKLAPN